MKKLLTLTILTITLAISLQLLAFSDVPHLIGYQGRLTDADGDPREGSFKITFRIYDAEAAGNLLWQEIHPNATVTGGIFDILLGSVTALDLPFDKQYYLAIQVGSDPEMTPRQQIASVGYAYKAESVHIIGIPFYISGFELEYIDADNIRVSLGAVDIDGRILTTASYSSNLTLSDSGNWVNGSKTPNSWAYVYLYNDNNTVGYKFSADSPDLADYNGNTEGTKRYKYYAPKYYRCIGAVRINNNSTVLKFYQEGNWVYNLPPVYISTSNSSSWTTVNANVGVPAFSTTALLKFQMDFGAARSNYYFRKTGETSEYFSFGGNSAEAPAVQVQMPLNTLQQFDWYSNPAYYALKARVMGYYVGHIK